MAPVTRWCPSCGAEYLADATRCADCGVALVDERPLTRDEIGGDEGEEHIEYQLDEYGAENRAMVDRLLTSEGIPHAWEAATLVVRAVDEEAVDHIVEQIDIGTGLDPEAEQVVYELDDLSEAGRTELVDALAANGIPYEWDENGDLVVLAADEERVDAMLDAIEDEDAEDLGASHTPGSNGKGELEEGEEGEDDDEGDDDQGLVAQDTLSDLFVAADRLMHDAEDHEGVLSLARAASTAETLAVPFGFAPAVWADIVEQAGALREILVAEDDAADDEAVMSRARTLRQTLRPYV